MKNKIIIDVTANTNKAMQSITLIRNQFETVYTENEVRKLIKAFRKRYQDECSRLPYYPKQSKVLKGMV